MVRVVRSAALLGLRAFDNSMHAVADRDYVVEASFACALLLVHLSRWAEEVVLWTSREFGFARLDDSVAKGSSLMPQKKNPEAAEVLRGKSGRVLGDLLAHLVQLKGLPLTYNSDLQEDKEALFDALDTAQSGVGAAAALSAASGASPLVLTATKGPAELRPYRWIALAASSLPVPLSPVISTDASDAAASAIRL